VNKVEDNFVFVGEYIATAMRRNLLYFLIDDCGIKPALVVFCQLAMNFNIGQTGVRQSRIVPYRIHSEV
jgi:hypothetical protein